jgi:hypothetical protein
MLINREMHNHFDKEHFNDVEAPHNTDYLNLLDFDNWVEQLDSNLSFALKDPLYLHSEVDHLNEFSVSIWQPPELG